MQGPSDALHLEPFFHNIVGLPLDQFFAQPGANATCRQQWTFVSRLRRDVPSGGASATQGDASANDCTSSPHFVAGALTDGAAFPSGTPRVCADAP